jgi:ABC-type uncharacterized transport system ATPase subunit
VIILRRGRIVADGTPAEVANAAALPVRVEIEVDVEHHAQALSIATSLAEQTPVADGPGRLRLEGVPRDTVAALVSALVMSGASVYRVSPEQPTLEDAYVALYGAGEER